jgi:hypothetical protein
VEIRGGKLQATRELMVIFRGGAQGRVLAIGGEGAWIRTVVPPNAVDGPVYVRLDGQSYEGPPFTVMPGNPVPAIEVLRPDYVLPGTTEASVRLEGWGFHESSRILLDGRELPGKTRTASAMEVDIPADVLAVPGRRLFRIENPAPGGGVSEEVPFQVSAEFNVLRAESVSSRQVRVVFDRPPSRELAADQRNWTFDCFT